MYHVEYKIIVLIEEPQLHEQKEYKANNPDYDGGAITVIYQGLFKSKTKKQRSLNNKIIKHSGMPVADIKKPFSCYDKHSLEYKVTRL